MAQKWVLKAIIAEVLKNQKWNLQRSVSDDGRILSKMALKFEH